MKNKKLANECIKCKNRFCSNGIITVDDDGLLFNEIACPKHTDFLYEEATRIIGDDNGVMRNHISSSGCLSRRIMREENMKRNGRN